MMINKHKQSGVALVVGLVLLLLLMLIGTSSIQVATLEEKMSYHQKDQFTALQAAEASLKAGEARIDGGKLADFTGSGGLLAPSSTDPDPWASSTWSSANSILVSFSSSVDSQPRYYIKHLSTNTVTSVQSGSKGNGGINIAAEEYGGDGRVGVTTPNKTARTDKAFFEVTARGTGNRDEGEVLLRSHFYKEFNS